MRLRTDLAVYAPGNMVAVKARFDMLDNLQLGSLPEGIPSASLTQRSPADAFRVKRAWGEVLLPFGFLTAGRMGTQWGLGMVANGGDCLDCDSSDAADRIAFLTPLAGHIWGVAYDFSATGPTGSVPLQNRTIILEPSTERSNDHVRVDALAQRSRARPPRARRHDPGRLRRVHHASLAEQNDVPSSYLADDRADRSPRERRLRHRVARLPRDRGRRLAPLRISRSAGSKPKPRW